MPFVLGSLRFTSKVRQSLAHGVYHHLPFEFRRMPVPSVSFMNVGTKHMFAHGHMPAVHARSHALTNHPLAPNRMTWQGAGESP
jgi:hypothetical protein